ncbi:IS1182 family transposase [Fictibacillus enclensis]|uniref:IS1182 family transposase n=1 Tax=Fictibacillus enclensis TaxID=1017270 RepID=UPI0024C02027|nr:IS1182 family transposase [Fictibacillus enclensis]WHY73227.1 IS1182 family transposase [Fictibacillus enclensis]
MRNLTITTENYTTQTSLPLGGIQESSSTKRKLAPTFKPYDNQQVQMIFDLQEWIPAHHVARVIDEMVEGIPDDRLFSYYSGGGRSSYHPKMMVKVLLYGYSQKVYSCRGIEKLLQENLPAMWLAAMQKPDFRTLNDFRGQRMKALMDELFETMIRQLIQDEYITMDHYFLDGTKIEADANKYSFVWKKSTVKHEAKLKEKIQETLHHINRLTELEALPEGDETSDELSLPLEEAATILDEEVTSLTDAIEKETNTEKRKEMRKKRSIYKKPLKLIRHDFLPRLAKYKEQNERFGDRNSYSKTDTDATFMRMKEDHMKNGQLKPGYNVQMATENQFVLFYSLHQRPTDTRCFIPHLEKLAASSLPMPKTVIADAGYGSEENYLFAVGEETEPRFDFLIPYGSYLKEQTRSYKNEIKNAKNWVYEELDDWFICPNGRRVPFKKYLKKKNRSGLEQSFKIYECEDCTDCPFKTKCTKAKGNRQVHWNTIYEEMKAKAKAALECEEKAAIYARRKVEVESVFGHIKGNRSFRRWSLRGLDKVHVEFGIVALAHNLLKVAGIRLTTFRKKEQPKKAGRKNLSFFRPAFILGTYWTASFLIEGTFIQGRLDHRLKRKPVFFKHRLDHFLQPLRTGGRHIHFVN